MTKKLIYLDDAIDAVEYWHGVDASEALEKLPSAQPDVATDINVGDTISRQQAIDTMQMFIDSLDKESPAYKSLRVAFNRCIIELKKIPSAQPHWIPCSEGMPLTYEGDIPVVETYIVTVSVDGVLFVDKAYSFGTYIDGFWDTVNDWDEGNDVHVLAWMPLPEPYRGENE